MNKTCWIIFSVALFVCVAMPMHAQQADATAAFNALVDQYFDFYFPFHPTQATQSGFHQYDSKLDDFSAAARNREIAGSKDFLNKFAAVDRSKLPPDTAADLDWIVSSIHSDLLELENIQMWRKDPDSYTSGVTNSVFVLMKRNFRNDVPQAFSEVKDAKLLADFKAVNQTVIDAFGSYQKYLQDSVLPHANGDFRLGAENYRKKLLYDEMMDIPTSRLLEIGYADLRRNQQQMKVVAAQIDPKHSVEEGLAELQKNHPPAGQLLQAFRDTLGGLQQFIEEKKIITIPAGVPPLLEETPPFMRATTEASIDTPGAYETKDTKAFFHVTTPDPKWTPDRIEEWMKTFNNSMIPGTAIHEAFPGHFVQFLWINQLPSKVRKLVACGSNAEGWAHYSEQMMLDEGYGNGDPKLRMGQLEDALLRNARFIVGIKMHTGDMTLDQAKHFFIEEGYQPPAVADVETKRGTADPTYLVYTLGKLQILKLRDDYHEMRGKDFSLMEFHDRLMQQGAVPLKIVRRAMLGNDSPTL